MERRKIKIKRMGGEKKMKERKEESNGKKEDYEKTNGRGKRHERRVRKESERKEE